MSIGECAGWTPCCRSRSVPGQRSGRWEWNTTMHNADQQHDHHDNDSTTLLSSVLRPKTILTPSKRQEGPHLSFPGGTTQNHHDDQDIYVQFLWLSLAKGEPYSLYIIRWRLHSVFLKVISAGTFQQGEYCTPHIYINGQGETNSLASFFSPLSAINEWLFQWQEWDVHEHW